MGSTSLLTSGSVQPANGKRAVTFHDVKSKDLDSKDVKSTFNNFSSLDHGRHMGLLISNLFVSAVLL